MIFKKIRYYYSILKIKLASHFKRIPIGAGLFLFLLSIFILLGFLFFPKMFLSEDVLREGLAGQPSVLNPLFSRSNEIDQTIVSLIFRGLVKSDSSGEFKNDLAKKIKISEDGKIYEIKLKEDLFWHDGVRVTVEDVIFTYQTIQAPDYLGFWREAFESVSFEKIDDQSLKIILSEPLASFMENLTVGIIPKHILENVSVKEMPNSSFSLKPIGTGEFIFISKQVDKSNNQIKSIFLKSLNENSSIKKINFLFYPDDSSLINAFKTGEIDSFKISDEHKLKSLSGWKNFNLFSLPINLRFYGLFFNTQNDKPINESGVRQALNYALDKRALFIEVFEIVPSIMNGPIEQTSWAYNQELSQYSYDRKKALSLLDQSGVKDLELTLTIPDNEKAFEIAEAVKKQWKRISVKVEIKRVALENFEREVIEGRNFEVLLYGQEVSSDPDRYPLWHSTRVEYPGLNITQISAKRIDKALEEGRSIIDPKVRKAKYDDFQKHFNDEMPTIFLYHPSYHYILNHKIKGIDIKNLDVPQNRFKNFNNWYIEKWPSWLKP